jgi:peptidoglycan/xylan/chitin deacetylase (PgdA/CDA1 family)
MISAQASKAHPLDGLVTVMWHYVRAPGDRPTVGATSVTPAIFDRQLETIGRHRTVVGWGDVAAALAGDRSLPARPALLTFDDGLVDHARTVTPRLVARGWPAVFFVLARRAGDPLTVGHAIHILLADLGEEGLRAAVEERLALADVARFISARERERAAGVDAIDVLKRPLQRDLADVVGPLLSGLIEERHGSDGAVADALHLSGADIAAMRRGGMTIAGHGRRHLWLDHEPRERIVAEVAESASFLANDPRPWAFAYPYGASSPVATAALAEHGFSAAFHASPRTPSGPFDLARIDAEDPAFEAIIAGSDSR